MADEDGAPEAAEAAQRLVARALLSSGGSGAGDSAGRRLLGDDGVLPIMGPRWRYAGNMSLDGAVANIWQYKDHVGEKTSSYTFYVTPDNRPLRLHMVGVNLMTVRH